MTWHDIALDAAYLAVKSPFRNIWPLVAVPALASLISDHVARSAPQTPAGSAPAAALAALPGVVGLVVILHAIDLGKVVTWHGVVFHWLTPLIAAAFALYAIARAVRRQSQVADFFAVAAPAQGRLASIAAQLDIRALEIPSEATDCFVAGVLRPTVFVSRGALARLDDAQLYAALHHERAHVRGRDTIFLAVLAFLRDLAPWGRGAALDAFRSAREAVADRAAARFAGSLNLAGALVALARPGGSSPAAAVLPMARADTFRWRMEALLGDGGTDAPSGRQRIRLAAGLALASALMAWPLVQFQLMEMLCGVR
jgi:Zn-dependent protease with chaperone function